jgi:hypothetical protein
MSNVLGFLAILLQDPPKPHGEVNDVCWKLLGIAGTGYVVLGGVIVVLAKKLWETSIGRLQDQKDIITQVSNAKQRKDSSG